MNTDKFTLFVYCNCLVLLSTTVCSQNINKQNVNIAAKLLQITAFSVGITLLNQRIIHKDDIEFVTEFPCFLGHPVEEIFNKGEKYWKRIFKWTFMQRWQCSSSNFKLFKIVEDTVVCLTQKVFISVSFSIASYSNETANENKNFKKQNHWYIICTWSDKAFRIPL